MVPVAVVDVTAVGCNDSSGHDASSSSNRSGSSSSNTSTVSIARTFTSGLLVSTWRGDTGAVLLPLFDVLQWPASRT